MARDSERKVLVSHSLLLSLQTTRNMAILLQQQLQMQNYDSYMDTNFSIFCAPAFVVYKKQTKLQLYSVLMYVGQDKETQFILHELENYTETHLDLWNTPLGDSSSIPHRNSSKTSKQNPQNGDECTVVHTQPSSTL
jgi:hypothetical protein